MIDLRLSKKGILKKAINRPYIFRDRENTGEYFSSLHIDRKSAKVIKARKIIKPVFSKPGEIIVVSQED